RGMDCKKIFNQSEILSKYPEILKKEGLEPVKYEPRSTAEGFARKAIRFLSCGYFGRKRRFDYNKLTKSEELNEALVSDYKSKKTTCKGYDIRKGALIMVVEGVFYALGYWKFGDKLEGGVGNYAVVAMFLFNRALSYSKSILPDLYSIYIVPLKHPIDKYEIDFAKCKRFLPEALQNSSVEAFDLAYQKNYLMDSKLEFLKLALQVPLRSKRLKPLTLEDSQASELLSGYEKKVAQKILVKFFNHYARFSKKASTADTPKTIFYLQGPPGVGKTFLTRKFAELMGAPLIELKVDKKIEKVIGNTDDPGSLLNAICRPGIPRNAIILFDEVDSFVNNNKDSLQFFLPFLEPSEKYFYSPYLKTNIDISHFCFVLCGNTPLENEAMCSRPTMIVIEDLSKDAKKKIAYKILNGKIGKNPELMNKIDEIIESYNKKGVRNLQDCIIDEIRTAQMYDLVKRLKKNKTLNNEQVTDVKNLKFGW
ncbi:AAA family ATPase, partial [Candidatus Dependentiae bacterium]